MGLLVPAIYSVPFSPPAGRQDSLFLVFIPPSPLTVILDTEKQPLRSILCQPSRARAVHKWIPAFGDHGEPSALDDVLLLVRRRSARYELGEIFRHAANGRWRAGCNLQRRRRFGADGGLRVSAV